MSRFVRRQFSIGSQESLLCEMRVDTFEGATLIVLREIGHQRLRGALTARFEYVANLVALELSLRRLNHLPMRFFQEHPGFANGAVSRPPIMQEVVMSLRDGQYCYARWKPVDSKTASWLSESSYSQKEEKRPL